MKKIYSILFMFMGIIMMGLSSCSDSMDEYKVGGPASGQGVFFPTSTINSYEAESATGSITVKVGRTISAEASEVEVKAVISEGGESLFEVPTKLSFEQDKLESELTIKYNNLVRGTTYTVTVSFPGNETQYSQSSLDFTIVWPNEVVYEWEVVSEKAVLIDNLFAEFSIKDLAITELTVEKAKGYDMYRFKSPYNNDYWTEVNGGPLLPDNYELPYIVLDGEKYRTADDKPLWYIESTCLGFKMINGVGPAVDTEWNTFGSVAGNLKTDEGLIGPNDPDYPLGSYDEKTKCFDFGATYHNLDGDNGGFIIHKQGLFKLYLDPALMSPDYNRDYTWVDVEDSEGEYISDLAGQNMVKVLQQAEEDETFYRIPDLYAQGYPLYFNLDKEAGTVSIPKEMPIETGMTVLGGNKVYVKGVSGKSSYNAENGVISLGLSFYLADEDGNEITELATSNDKFVWGKSGVELFKPGVAVDEYLGNWGMVINAFMNDGSIAPYEIEAKIEKTTDTDLTVKGILGLFQIPNYDDSFNLSYQPSTGLLELRNQKVADLQGELFLKLTDGENLAGDNDRMIGGISIIDGHLKFISDESNTGEWSYITYYQQPYVNFGYIELDWTAIEAETTTSSVQSVKPMIFKPSDIKSNDKKFNVKLYKSTKTTSSNLSLKIEKNSLSNMSTFRLVK